ncbi:hypothetical protein PATSB16_04900 [Pandoraea thiooxydans]|nr:hypothetical protein PATSB16_04900 [Pandoraea thiooxydans]
MGVGCLSGSYVQVWPSVSASDRGNGVITLESENQQGESI